MLSMARRLSSKHLIDDDGKEGTHGDRVKLLNLNLIFRVRKYLFRFHQWRYSFLQNAYSVQVLHKMAYFLLPRLQWVLMLSLPNLILLLHFAKICSLKQRWECQYKVCRVIISIPHCKICWRFACYTLLLMLHSLPMELKESKSK